jgi:hypothetical protein
MGKNTVEDDFREWTEKRWDVILPIVFTSAEEAVDELIASWGDKVTSDMEPNYFINHEKKEVRRAFAILAGKVAGTIEFIKPSRATFDKNLGRIRSEIYAYTRHRAFKELFQ